MRHAFRLSHCHQSLHRRNAAAALLAVIVVFLGAIGLTSVPAHASADTYPFIRTVLVDAEGNLKNLSGRQNFPSGNIADQVAAQGMTQTSIARKQAVYVGAYWLSQPFADSLQNIGGHPDSTEFAGKRLPIKSLTKQDGDVTIVTPTDDVASPHQQEVILSANSNDVPYHVVLVYMDLTDGKYVQFTYGQPFTDSSSRSYFRTENYDVETDRAVFSSVDPNASGTNLRYTTRAHVRIPRGQEVSFRASTASGAVQSVDAKLESDNSTTDFTIQTWVLTVGSMVERINVTATDVTSRKVKVVAKMEGEPIPLYRQPRFNISKIDRGDGRGWQEWTKCKQTGLAWYEGGDNIRRDTCLPNATVGSKAIDYMPNGEGPAGGRFARTWGWQTDTANGGYRNNPETRDEQNPRIVRSESSYTMTAGNSIGYVIEAVPDLWDNRTDPNGGIYRQDFLSSITLTNEDQAREVQSNEQTVFVPFPDLCRDAFGNLPPDDPNLDINQARYCYSRDNFYAIGVNPWSGPGGERNRMSCIRSWLLGVEINNHDLWNGCNSSFDWNQYASAPRYTQPRMMLDHTITYGANAGVRIVVKLINARTGTDVGTSILDNSYVTENSGSFPASINSSRWRTRYQIEVYNLKNKNVTVTANWAWSDQQRVLLGASTGIEPISESNDPVKTTAVSVYGVGNPSVGGIDGTQNWKSICVDGENLGIDNQPNGGAGCRYVWQDQGNMNTMPVGFRVKNGYRSPAVFYAPNRFTVGDSSGGLLGYRSTTTNPVTQQVDGNRYVDLPKQVTTVIKFRDDDDTGNRNRTFLMKSRVPLYVYGTTVDIPLTYYDDQAHPLRDVEDAHGDKVFADQTVNTVAAPFHSVAPLAPALESLDADGHPQVFTHWVLQAYRGGVLLGNVGNKAADGSVKAYDELSPRDLLYLDNPVLTSVSADAATIGRSLKVGDPVVTDGTGSIVADELRIVAVPMTATSDTSGLTRHHDYYNVSHLVQSSDKHQVQSFVYTAVAGLDASIAPTHIAKWPTETWNNEVFPYVASASTVKIGDPSQKWNAATNPGLETPKRSILEMIYRKPGAHVAFGKRVDTTLYDVLATTPGAIPGYDFAAGSHAATDFKLLLTPKAPATGSAVSIQARDLSAPDGTQPGTGTYLPAGTYTISETVTGSDGSVSAHPWYPRRGQQLRCTNATVGANGTEVTVKATDQVVDCQITNTTAALAVLTFDASTGTYLEDQAYAFKADVPSGETYASSLTRLPVSGTVPAALTWAAPDVTYNVSPTALQEGYTLIGYQKYSLNDRAKALTATTDKANWEPVNTTTPQAGSSFVSGAMLSDPSKKGGVTSETMADAGALPLTPNAGEVTVVRAVVAPTSQLTTLTFQASTDSSLLGNTQPKGDSSTEANFALQLTNSADGAISSGAVRHGSTNLDMTNPHPVTVTSKNSGRFYLRADTAYTYKERYKGGSVTSAVTGMPDLSDNYRLNNAWAPTRMTCTPEAKIAHRAGSLTAGDGAVTFPAGNVSCTMTNQPARLAVLQWDEKAQRWLGADGNGDDYTVTVTASNANALAGPANLAASGDNVSTTAFQVTPGDTYSVTSAHLPFMWKHSQCEILTDSAGRPVNYTSETSLTAGTWTTQACNNIVVPAGNYYVIRATSYNAAVVPKLPITGGMAKDYYLIGGALIGGAGLVIAPLIRRRKTTSHK